MSQKDEGERIGSSDDDLLQRYRDASEQDTIRPGAHVRDAVRDHALMMLAAHSAKAAVPVEASARTLPAANQSRWKISAFASLAVAGLTGLLVFQFDRSSQEEKEQAFGQHGPMASASQDASTAPPASSDAGAGAGAGAVQSGAASRHGEARNTESKAARTEKNSAPTASTERQRTVRPAPAAPTAEVPSFSRKDETQAMAPSSAPPAPDFKVPSPAVNKQELATLPQTAGSRGRPAQVAPPSIQESASLNAVDEVGRTPLMLAVIHGNTALVQQLLAAGANPALADREGLTALQHAHRLGLPQIEVLLQGKP